MFVFYGVLLDVFISGGGFFSIRIDRYFFCLHPSFFFFFFLINFLHRNWSLFFFHAAMKKLSFKYITFICTLSVPATRIFNLSKIDILSGSLWLDREE